MSKHTLSPALLPAAKRLHTLQAERTAHDLQLGTTFDSLLFDELILVIFSYLSYTDLCAIQSINRNWSRLSLDNQLWKSLYISEYGRLRLRGARGFIGRGDGREVKPLPGRAKLEDVRDWKWMFRISSNWRTGTDSVTHTQTLSSFTSYPPSSLVLSTPSATTYKLILAYAIPVYPAHWTVGATELIISSTRADRMVVVNTRTTRAIDIPPGWVDETKMRAVREQWDRKVARVADTQTDGKWVVLAPGQNLPLLDADTPGVTTPHSSSLTSSSSSSSPASSPPLPTYVSSSMYSASGLQLYRLHLPASPSGSSLPRLTFVRTLHGQLGPVSTLALSDGRCVSLGVNGSIWVWDLEAGTGTEVSAGTTAAGDEGDTQWERARLRLASGTRGAVVFDDRRIVSACGAGVEVRRFDI
ncbi:hypothetical protein GSI_03598 [Ganoderma sinense ZZ0214-1]|uniref:F-box domain-containing protein n=1 Tax=Ganoderma sinense ZZ0214-1 TaxID=1077348 RepID=A0A2G8SJE8_9APHY|nr:hypothetical protein GSI_03598 [Ganoderma sinense ZZ0214-1]